MKYTLFIPLRYCRRTVASRDSSVRLLKQVLPPDREENLHFLQGLIQGHTELGPETRIPASKFNSFYYIIPPLLDKSHKKGSLKTELIKKGLYGCGIVGNEPECWFLKTFLGLHKR